MTTAEFVYSIIGFIVLIACAVIGILTHYRAEKGTGYATGYKSGNSTRSGQRYTFTASDGKTYTAHMFYAGAKVSGFLDLNYPDEVEVQYDEKNPSNNIIMKKNYEKE